ncbi:hypothetical protein Pelo_889 [Pelomyxa schiedti]|nr:hypothetical protein Pelo_889 [Pelomyxa schiedti]
MDRLVDRLSVIGRFARHKGTTGPDDAATQLHWLLGVGISDLVAKYITTLPPLEDINLQLVVTTTPLDTNFTRKVFRLLNEFDEWNENKTNPQFGEHVSWIIGGLLTAVRKLLVEKKQEREEAIQFLNEAASHILVSIFHVPSADETAVAEKDNRILTALRALQQEDRYLFDVLVNLLGCRCSNVALLQSTYLTPKRELQLQILHLALNFIQGIQNESQLLWAWDSFVREQFFPRCSPSIIVDFFNKPPVLYKQLSSKMPPKVSLSVLQGAVMLFQNTIKSAAREENAEATRDIVEFNNYYHDLLNLTCPSLRQGETGNAQRMGSWWYWLEWIAGLEDLGERQSLIAPFLERTLQYGLEAVRTALLEVVKSENDLKFFDISVTHFFQSLSSFATLQQLPIMCLELKILQSILWRNALVWEPHQIGWVLDKYAQILVSRYNLSPQSGRLKFLPLRDLLHKSFNSSFMHRNVSSFLRISLYCPDYSTLFSFEDHHDLICMKDIIMKKVDAKPLTREFANTVKALFLYEKEKPDQQQSPLFLLMLKTVSALIVSAEAPQVGSTAVQLCSLGTWIQSHLSNLSKQEGESSIVIAVLMQSVQLGRTIAVNQVMDLSSSILPLFRLKDLESDHPFFKFYEAGCQQLCGTIRAQVERICNKQVTLQEIKSWKAPPTHSTHLNEIYHALFPDVELPDINNICILLQERFHHLQIVWFWLAQKGGIHPPGFDVHTELCLRDYEHLCNELQQSIHLCDWHLKAVTHFLVNSSLLFGVYFMDFARNHYGEKVIPSEDLDKVIGSVLVNLQQFAHGNVWLNQIPDLCKAVNGRGSTDEGKIIAKYFSENGDEVVFAPLLHDYWLEHYLQDGLALWQCVELIPSVLDCSHKHSIPTKAASSLIDLHQSLTASPVSLKSCAQHVVLLVTLMKEFHSEVLDEQKRMLVSERQNALAAQKVELSQEKEGALLAQADSFNIEKRNTLERQASTLSTEKLNALRQQELLLNTEKHHALEQQKSALEVEKENALRQQRSTFEEMQSRSEKTTSEHTNAEESVAAQQAYALEVGGNLETVLCGFQKGRMALVELNDLDLTRATFIANGSFGTVCRVPIVFQRRGLCVTDDHGPTKGPKEVAVKMMFNYSAGMKTLQLRTEFEREYEVAVMHPHWCFTNVFNHFRGHTSLSLIGESMRMKYTIVDEDRNWVSGCTNDRAAIPVFQRTTFMTMELGKCTLESLLSTLRAIPKNTPITHSQGSPSELDGISSQPPQHPLGTTRDVLQLAFCMLCAVDHLNTRGWFHCDIKSDNILLMERPHIKGNIWALCDLGTAVFCQDGKPLVLPNGETFPGNMCNRSPEVIQALMKFPLLKNDVWAVGCVLFETFSGRHPFARGNDTPINLIRDTTLPPVIPRRKNNTSSHQTPPPSAALSSSASSTTTSSSSPPAVDLDAVLAGLVGWLLERDCSRRPTSHEALLACGAILSLPLLVITQFLTHIENTEQNKGAAMAKSFSDVTAAAPAAPSLSQSALPQSTGTTRQETQQCPQQAREDMIAAMRQSLFKEHRQTLTDIFQRNGLRLGVDVVPSVSPSNSLQVTVNEVMRLVYCNMALRDVPAAARALLSFLDAASSPRYNLNLLSL